MAKETQAHKAERLAEAAINQAEEKRDEAREDAREKAADAKREAEREPEVVTPPPAAAPKRVSVIEDGHTVVKDV